MAKQYKVKDINNNGKIDGWEQGKYDAINNSATKMYKKEKSPMKMGYAMKMGSKENYSPTNFKTKDTMLMADSPMMMHKEGHKNEGVVLTGDKSKINNKVNVPSAVDKRAAAKAKIAERKQIMQAKIAEKKNEYTQMRQVQKDAIANRKLQLQRKKEGKDYILLVSKIRSVGKISNFLINKKEQYI